MRSTRSSGSPSGRSPLVQPGAQEAGALHQVAPPVVREHVASTPARGVGLAVRPRVTRGSQEVQEVSVFGEAEDPRQDRVGSDEPTRHQVVAALREGQRERKCEVVGAQGVPDVEPEVRAVRLSELAAQDARDHHHRRGFGIVAGGPEQGRIQGPTRDQGLGEHGRRGARGQAADEIPEGLGVAALRGAHRVSIFSILAWRAPCP